MEKFKLYTLKNIDAPNFLMTPMELHDYIDFDVKRVYFIVNPKTGDSGGHCHYVEKECFILIRGKCTAIIDQGNGKEEITLEGPKNAIYVGNYVWHGFQDMSPDVVILALSSTNYSPDRSDYLEDYEAYLKIRDEKLKESV
jgi:uncharacterized cupin superfamily protein